MIQTGDGGVLQGPAKPRSKHAVIEYVLMFFFPEKPVGIGSSVGISETDDEGAFSINVVRQIGFVNNNSWKGEERGDRCALVTLHSHALCFSRILV